MEEERNARNQQKLPKKIKAKQLAAQMVLLSKEMSRVQSKASQLAMQMVFVSKESVKVLRNIVAV